MATFDTPDYVIGNSSTVQGQMITVLTQLDQALQALQPAPNATTVQFNDTILLTDGSTNTNTISKNSIFIKDNSIGYTTTSAIEIENINSTLNNFVGVPSMEYYKSGRIGAAADIIMSQQFNAINYLGAKTTFGKIECSITSNNVPLSGGVDGAIDFYTCVNGSNNNVFRLNGQDNENNTFRPFDLNGNLLKTSQGNIIIDATASAGTGSVDITAKTGSVVNINSNVVMDNSESFIQRNSTSTIYNNQTQSSINLVDTSIGSIVNSNTNDNISQILTNDTTLQTLTNESYCNLQRVNKFDKTLSADVERTDIYSNLITMNDSSASPTIEQVDIRPTSIQFTSSGSASDSLAMYNDSADGGEIDWSNVTGTNGLAITSSHSLTLKSTTATFPLQLDSDVINLQNTNTTTSTSNHNADIRSTSTGLESTTFLKLQLNGADIWIPYFTADPSI